MSPIYLRNRSEAWGHTCCAQALARGGDEVPGSNHGERESLSQLAGRIRGIEDEVKLREGKVWKRGREREREDGEKAGEERKDQSIVNVSAAPPDPTGQNTALGPTS